jgi:hypothetical protein
MAQKTVGGSLDLKKGKAQPNLMGFLLSQPPGIYAGSYGLCRLGAPLKLYGKFRLAQVQGAVKHIFAPLSYFYGNNNFLKNSSTYLNLSYRYT